MEQLTYFIEKDELDHLTFTKRKGIQTILNNISTQLNQAQRNNFNLSQIPNVGNVFISNIISLKDQIDYILFFNKGKGVVDYLDESKEIIKIKKRYHKLISIIEQVEKDKEIIIESKVNLTEIISGTLKSISDLEQNSNKIIILNSQIQKLYDQIKTNAEDIEGKKITINSLHKTANELEKIFENANSKANELTNKVSTTFNSFVKDKTKIFEEKVAEYQRKTNDIIENNLSLQGEIKTLLEGVSAGELYKAFYSRKRDIEKTLKFWFWSIIIINLIIVLFTLLIINGSEFLGIKPLSPSTMDAAFYLKLFISIPLVFLDWFIIRQYNQRKDLAEKYAFKSVISISLLAYNEMMIKNKENLISLEFISNTVEKIYQSPFDTKRLTKVELEVLNRLAEKGLEKIDKVNELIH